MVESLWDILYVFRPPQQNVSIETVFNRVNAGVQKYFNTLIYTFDSRRSLLSNILQVRKLKAQLYHVTGDISYIAILLFYKKVVLTIHDIGHYKNLKGWKKVIYGIVWVQLPMYFSKRITVVSEYTKMDLQNHFQIEAKKVHVVHNPVSDKFVFHRSVFNRQEPRILIVGTAIHKNVENTVRALEGVNCLLIIVGPLTNEIKSLIQVLKIKYEQFDKLHEEALSNEYVQCDLLLFVSRHEGFGMPVIEAQAIGRPVIVSKVCSLPEVAGPEACFVEDPEDVLEIRNRIQDVINNDLYREHLISFGLSNVKRFQTEKIAAQYAVIYNSLLCK